MASTLSEAEAHEVVVAVGLETGRVLLVHELIWCLDLRTGERKQDDGVPGDIPADGDPVKRRAHPVVRPRLDTAESSIVNPELPVQRESRGEVVSATMHAYVPGARCRP
jgi:hypothetical protein